MSIEQNKALLRRLYAEVYAKGNLNVLDELISADCVDHNPLPGQAAGREGIRDTTRIIRAAFPDLKVEEQLMIAEGDQVHGRVRIRGTHRGEFLGVAATNKPFEVTGMDTVTIRNGKVVAWYHEEDFAGFLQQVGALQLGTGGNGAGRTAQVPSAERPRTRQ